MRATLWYKRVTSVCLASRATVANTKVKALCSVPRQHCAVNQSSFIEPLDYFTVDLDLAVRLVETSGRPWRQATENGKRDTLKPGLVFIKTHLKLSNIWQACDDTTGQGLV
eukprot:m.32129 g.32129  ORF g.32129 m.32129 type:complete len:111 (-) comp9951_c0_seq1:126-458(-)